MSIPVQKQPCLILAIDGGAASGKSSTSRRLAEVLDLLHVDTGAHYRTLTRILLDRGISSESILKDPSVLGDVCLGTLVEGRTSRLQVDGQVPDDEAIRSEEVNRKVSYYAAVVAVRQLLLDYQRGQVRVACEHGFEGLVMEGRDIGSVVFPEAPYRFFLEADPATRQARREKEGQQDSIESRDKIDSSRTHAPLTCASGALRIDTGALSLEEVVARIVGIVAA